jgi:trypsin-like peptidase
MNSHIHGADPSLSIVSLADRNDQRVGVGFLISDQHVLTCAHVVNAALGRSPRAQDRPPPDMSIVVKFPTLPGRGDLPFRRGRVVEWYAPPAQPRFEFGDIACVALSKARPQKAVPAVVSVPTSSRAQRVRVFGYPSDPPRPEGHWISCDLASGVGGGFLQLDGSSATGLRAQPGYSGSPVWVEEGGVVVGMLAIAPSGGRAGDAYAISARDFASIYRSVSGSDPVLPREVVTARRAGKALSAELDQWRSFIAENAEKGWINYYEEMPSTDAWGEYGDLLSHIAPETATKNLIMVYHYFEALIKAHEQLEGWKDTATSARNAQLDKVSENEADAPLGEYAAKYAAAGIIHSAFQMGTFAWFFLSMMRKQLKDSVSQDRLRVLPENLSLLSQEVRVIGAESPPLVTGRRLEEIALPAFPLIEIKKDASIRFTLAQMEKPDARSSHTSPKMSKWKAFRRK